MTTALDRLAGTLGLGSLLELLAKEFGGYIAIDHWQQGEFHHDLVVRPKQPADLPGPVLVVATNCNGGVKEVLAFDAVPERWPLWHFRCPDAPDFSGELPPLLGVARTVHWFEPCELLADNARSELKPSCRRRAHGGGWEPA